MNHADRTTQVFIEEITNKWREEIAQSGKDVTDSMIEYIMDELKWKAEEYKRTGIITAYDPGVIKSDTIISKDLQQKLINAVKPLEDVPEKEKDYHPRSDDKVVDLVHPSLFPLIYGRTKILPDKLISLDDCFFSVGQGEVIKVPEEVTAPQGWNYHGHDPYSHKFQWLPCNVEFTHDGQCKIASYINNLHPAKHRELYGVIEQIMTRALPLWNLSLTSQSWDIPRRIKYRMVDYLPDVEPEPEQGSDEEDEAFWDRQEAWQERRQPIHPEPRGFQAPEPEQEEPLLEQFRENGLQVIVKLANIELTPEKPEYEGGSWHIEGQLVRTLWHLPVVQY
jgi:hypothetical protein